MTVLALEDYELEDRAAALVSIASKYDELHAVLTGAGRWMTDDRAQDALVAMARPFAHPLLGEDTLRELVRDLRDACAARETYEIYGFLPDDLDTRLGDTYSAEEVDDALDLAINAALFPLLTASATPCQECKRIKPDVTRWNLATHGLTCEQHRLYPVVGLPVMT